MVPEKKQRYVVFLGCLVLAVILFGGYLYWSRHRVIAPQTTPAVVVSGKIQVSAAGLYTIVTDPSRKPSIFLIVNAQVSTIRQQLDQLVGKDVQATGEVSSTGADSLTAKFFLLSLDGKVLAVSDGRAVASQQSPQRLTVADYIQSLPDDYRSCVVKILGLDAAGDAATQQFTDIDISRRNAINTCFAQPPATPSPSTPAATSS